ncbi:DNA primase [uncultured Desulfobacterium sp.]|uniref:DNA primase n=1 Tax=uncultured Desulfobacterium sp. TaxID=201089 RepID=A0A445MTL4_9BACT|nr:DNA primase [uncultured Desulfobacterium sp.]
MNYQSAKDEIKRTADVVQLIGQYVTLRKAGRNYVGLCPFHPEKAPSFTVNPERQTFHCFGCKKGGDIFVFWMEYHSTTFSEAIRDLAERYNITISGGYSATAEKEKAELRNALYRVTEIAADYFQRALQHPVRGRPGSEYFIKRGITDEIISEFRLGYAPNEWDGLIRVIKDRRIDINVGFQAGLIVQNERGGFYDRFRGRVIYPIIDQRQQVVGFGGRVLDDSLPKYMNSPETPIFHKGETLYGLNASFKAIREKGRAVIVEGYMDWLALVKHGLKEVVATLGTALTDRHVRKLKGYAKEAMVIFDSDSAGKSAALRSIHVFANEGLPARAVVLPEGHDPDSFVNQKGLESLNRFMNEAPLMFDFFLEQKMQEGNSDEAKADALKEILPALVEIKDFTLRSLYMRRVSERIGIREEALAVELDRLSRNVADTPKMVAEENLKSPSANKTLIRDLQLLNLLLNYPDTIPRLMECDCTNIISDSVIREIVDFMFEKYLLDGPVSHECLLDGLKSDACREQLREALHKPFIIYSDKDVEQAVDEFEEEVHQRRISESLKNAKGNLEAQNQLLKLKKQRATSRPRREYDG